MTTATEQPETIHAPLSIEARVNAGAMALDATTPGWWTADKIDLDGLHLQFCDACVLGQIYGNFWNGVEFHFGELPRDPAWVEHKRWAAFHGFLAEICVEGGLSHSPEAKADYAALRLAWVALIEYRRTEDARRCPA